MGNGKHNAPLTPPIQKVMFEKCPRTPRSMNQLKSVKSGLCSSLDQGLDKPPQSLMLSNQSKRIYKSEESAIDEKHLSLPRDTSSDETLDDTVFENISASIGRPTEGYVKNSNNRDIESDIEILIPVSVSKAKNSSDNNEDSSNSKQRSSNSISSCEMALSNSQNEIDDSPSEKCASKSSTNGECFSMVVDENLRISQTLSNKNETDSKSLSSNESSANAYELYNKEKSQETLTEIREKEGSVVSRNSVRSEDTLSNSYASLDDKASYRWDRNATGTNVAAACSYPETWRSGMAALTSRGYDSDGR